MLKCCPWRLWAQREVLPVRVCVCVSLIFKDVYGSINLRPINLSVHEWVHSCFKLCEGHGVEGGDDGELYYIMSGKCSPLLDIKHLTRKCFNEGKSNENMFKLAWMLMTIPHEIHLFDWRILFFFSVSEGAVKVKGKGKGNQFIITDMRWWGGRRWGSCLQINKHKCLVMIKRHEFPH